MGMNKAELVSEMAKTLNSEKEARVALDSILDGITGALGNGGSLTLTGFGTFKVVNRKARSGVNPRTGEKIKIKAGKSIKFSPGKRLKEAV